ncbi:MAG TPA: hypothetical protein VFW66_08035 [Gemmatimonadales bacterium]|nr:hypothetical protein [Gemmatimonadales bacterium]
MPSASRSLKLVLVTVVLGACGNGASGQATSAATKRGGPQSYCPSFKDVSTAAGFPVTLQVAGGSPDSYLCDYEMTGRYRGTTIELRSNPASLAEDVFSKVKKSAKVTNGADAERIDVGSGGWAYGGGGSEAAAVGGGHVFHVALQSSPLSSIGDQKDALVRILKLALQTTPGVQPGSGPNVCSLATSAEFDEAYEVDPQMRGFASDPMATDMSWGPHCDYDGGSIDLIQTKPLDKELDRVLELLKAGKQPRLPVAGLGQRAFFTIISPDDENNRRGFLAVYAGPRIVAFSMMSHGHEGLEATRPRLERFAKLVLPRVK